MLCTYIATSRERVYKLDVSDLKWTFEKKEQEDGVYEEFETIPEEHALVMYILYLDVVRDY